MCSIARLACKHACAPTWQVLAFGASATQVAPAATQRHCWGCPLTARHLLVVSPTVHSGSVDVGVPCSKSARKKLVV